MTLLNLLNSDNSSVDFFRFSLYPVLLVPFQYQHHLCLFLPRSAIQYLMEVMIAGVHVLFLISEERVFTTNSLVNYENLTLKFPFVYIWFCFSPSWSFNSKVLLSLKCGSGGFCMLGGRQMAYHETVTPYFNLVRKTWPCPFYRRTAWLIQLSRGCNRWCRTQSPGCSYYSPIPW